MYFGYFLLPETMLSLRIKCETYINVALKEKWSNCIDSYNVQGCFLRSSKFPKIRTERFICKILWDRFLGFSSIKSKVDNICTHETNKNEYITNKSNFISMIIR